MFWWYKYLHRRSWAEWKSVKQWNDTSKEMASIKLKHMSLWDYKTVKKITFSLNHAWAQINKKYPMPNMMKVTVIDSSLSLNKMYFSWSQVLLSAVSLSCGRVRYRKRRWKETSTEPLKLGMMQVFYLML